MINYSTRFRAFQVNGFQGCSKIHSFLSHFCSNLLKKWRLQPDKRSLIGLKVQYRLMLCSVFRKTGQTAKLRCCIRHAVILRVRAADKDDILAVDPDGHARGRAVGRLSPQACTAVRLRCRAAASAACAPEAPRAPRWSCDQRYAAYRFPRRCLLCCRPGRRKADCSHCRRAPVHFPAQGEGVSSLSAVSLSAGVTAAVCA